MESDLYASKAYSSEDVTIRRVSSDGARQSEIYGLVTMLKSAVDDIEKSVAIQRERLTPVRGERAADPEGYPNEKRSCITPLGEDLNVILQRLYSLRNRIDETTHELEI